MHTVAAIPSIALVAGSAFGLFVGDLSTRSLQLALHLALAASVAVAVWSLFRGHPSMLATAVTIGFFSGGGVLSERAWQTAWRPPLRAAFERVAREQRAAAEREGRRPSEDDPASASIVGVLIGDAAPTPNGASLYLRVTRLEGEGQEGRERIACGGVLLTVLGSLVTERIDEWRAGRVVRLPAQLRRPARFLSPGVPDGERALARRGVTLVGTVKSGALVELIARGPWWSEALATARAFVRRAIEDAVARWNPQSGAVVAAIVIGDRSTLDDEIQERLQEAGTYHVIAISGGNIAILAGLVVGAFRMAGWFGRGALAASIAILIGYAALVGGGASVDRATLMAVLYFGARLFDQRSPPLNTLAVGAALLVLTNPLSIADPAFLLTFGATFAILIVVPAFDCSKLPFPVAAAAATFLASAAAEVVLFPVSAMLFSRITFAGLALNFAAIPLMSVAQVAGMAVVPLVAVSRPLAASLGWIAHVGASGLIASADLVRFAPAVAWRAAPPSPWVCLIYYGCLGMAWFGWRRHRAIAGSSERSSLRTVRRASAVLAGVASLWILTDPRTFMIAGGDGMLHATFIDVGQGDAAFIAFPRGSTLLVDAGGLGFASSFDIGDRVVAPVVRSLGFRRIDRVALTHGDPDHIAGARSIVREFRPREVWEGIPVPRSDPLMALRTQALGVGARWANVHAGDHLTIDEVAVIALHPEREEWERQKVRNDDSLVLELRWRDVSIVFTGDIGRVPEQRIAPALAPARLRVVKVPHHGSLTSSSQAFVQALRPTVAIVSAGRGNRFGHPAPEVLQRYESAGARVFRTDRDGAVAVETDGTSLSVTTVTGRRF